MSAEITNVIPSTPAAINGVKAGDLLISINGHNISDVLDYMYYSSEPVVKLLLKRESRHIMLKICKNEYDDLGLEFETFLMDKKKSCCNKCVFCFIDQMPEGMRDTLYFKDDDARLSFLQGNYVTLTNLSESDIDRIIEMKLNINVSVHTTNPELRCKMMNNRFAGEKIAFLKKMADAGISMNCQIVLCPGLNDGDELRRTLTDLGELMPNISSVAIVPVGLTKFRQNLYPLELFDKAGAEKALDIINEFQQKFYSEYGTKLVFASDEFYLTAQRELPDGDFYEGYPQYENGVGMIRSLADEFEAALENSAAPDHYREVSIATGASAFELISALARETEEKYKNIKCHVYKIVNNYFGDTITVSGLLTASDIMEQLNGKQLGSELLLTSSMIMHGSDLFLDDYRISDVEKALNIKIRLTSNDGDSLVDAILGI